MQKNNQISSVFMFAAVGIVGCSGADPRGADDQIALGRVDLPLSTTASNGTKYALAGQVDLVGPQGLTATMSPADPAFVDQPLFFTTTAGSYTLTLSNWSLYDVVGMPPSLSQTSGAILVSPATLPVDIVANQTAHAGYRFAVPGGVATFGNGSLNVDVSVDVGYPDGTACTQNSDCASNACVNGVCGAAAGACDPTVPNSCPMGQSCVVDPTTGLGACQASSAGIMGCLKINEVSTGAAGAPSDEFVELYNACASTVDVSGARLLYRAAAGVNDVALTTAASPGSTVPAGGFLVFGGQAYTGPSNGLLSGAMAAAGGGIAIVDSNGAKVDSVGYGTATNIYIETTVAVAPAPGNSIGRRPDGGDTDNGSVDFSEQPRSPGAPNL